MVECNTILSAYTEYILTYRFAVDKINPTQKSKFALERVENIGNREPAGYQHFRWFPQHFHTPLISQSMKVWNYR